MVERLTPNQQASTSWVTPWRRWTRVARSRSTKTSLCFAPAPTARRRGRDDRAAWCRSCHNGPISATSSAITSGLSPVIRWLRMIAARARSSTMRTMINDQGTDAPPPTTHERVSSRATPRAQCATVRPIPARSTRSTYRHSQTVPPFTTKPLRLPSRLGNHQSRLMRRRQATMQVLCPVDHGNLCARRYCPPFHIVHFRSFDSSPAQPYNITQRREV